MRCHVEHAPPAATGQTVALGILALLGLVVLALFGIVGIGQVVQHPLLLALLFAAVTLVGTVAKWRAQNYQAVRPWLRQGTNDADRRYQERWEKEHVREKLRGGREDHWRE